MTNSPSVLRTILVDDEPLARTHVRGLLAEHPELEVVGEAGNGRDAVALIAREQPDLVFLDIQMPELDGFGVVQAIGAEHMPVTIFVSAYDEYALKAFEAHALDYLMKPVDRERFRHAVERAIRAIRRDAGADARAPLAKLIDQLRQDRRPVDRLAIKQDGRVIFLRIPDIDWVETDGDHVRIHIGPHVYVHRMTLTRLEEKLSESQFLRIHRSTLVNVDRIREMQPWFQGDYVLIMHDGTRLTTGRSYRERLKGLLERWK